MVPQLHPDRDALRVWLERDRLIIFSIRVVHITITVSPELNKRVVVIFLEVAIIIIHLFFGNVTSAGKSSSSASRVFITIVFNV